MNPAQPTHQPPPTPALRIPWLLVAGLVVLVAALGAVVAGTLLLAGPAEDPSEAAEPGQAAPPFPGEIPVGEKARPVAGDARLKEGQYVVAEPRPAVDEKATLSSVAFSPDGTLLVTAGPNNLVTLRDARTGARKAALSVSQGHMIKAVFSPDGHLLAAASVDDQIPIWEVRTGKLRRTLKAAARNLAFTPDGSRLVTMNPQGLLQVWDVEKGTAEREFTEKGPRLSFSPSLALSPDGKWLAILQKEEKAVTVLDFATGGVRRRFDDGKGEVYTFAFTPDSKALAVSGGSGAPRLVLYDLDSGKPRWGFAWQSGWLTRLAFSPTGKTLAAGRDNGGGIDLFDARTGKQTTHIPGVRMTVADLAFSPDGGMLAAVDNYEWRIHSWAIVPSNQQHTVTVANTVFRVRPSRSGKLLVVATAKGVEVYETARAKKLRTLGANRSWVNAVPGPDEKSVVADASLEAVVFDLATGQGKPSPDQLPNDLLAYTPDGKVVRAGSDGVTVSQGKEEPRRLEFGIHRSLALSADGKRVAAGDERGWVRVWEVETGKRLGVLDAHEGAIRALALSPDGRHLASGGDHDADHTVRIWEAATGKELATLRGHTAGVIGLMFSPDGKLLVSGGRDGRLLVWDVATGKLRRSLRGHVQQVNGLVPVGAGRFVTVEDELKRILFWDWATAAEPDPDFRPPTPPQTPPPAFLTRIKSLGPSPKGFTTGTTFSPNRRWLAWVDEKVIHVRDLKSGKDAFALKGHAETPGRLLFSPDEKYLVSSDVKTIRWWDLHTGKEVKDWQVGGPWPRALAWAEGGKTLVTVGYFGIDYDVRFWDAATGRHQKLAEDRTPPNPERVCVSPDGRLVAVAGNYVVLLDARTRAVVHNLKPETRAFSLAFSPDSKLLAVGGDKTVSDAPITVYDVGSGRLVHTLTGYVGKVWTVAFAHGGQGLLGSGQLASGPYALRLWDVKTGMERARMPAFAGADIVDDGKHLITFRDKEGIALWNFEDAYDAPLQAALAPLVKLGADGELRDGVLWIALKIQGRLSREALDRLGKVPRPLGLKLADIEDADLTRLASARNVKALDLTGSSVREEAAKALQQLTWLERLTVRRSAFSEETLQALKKSLPKLRINTVE